MRLTEKQIKGIISGVQAHLQDAAELRLYGSRTDDTARGGDIDLLLISENKATAAEKKYAMLVAIKTNIGDQKIDLMIADRRELETDPFLKLIFPTSIILYQFK